MFVEVNISIIQINYIILTILILGCIVSGSELCQYKLKQTGFENQQWEASIDGYIQCKSHKNVVLAISDHTKKDYPVLLANKKTPDHEEQRWIFVIPRFEHKASKSFKLLEPKHRNSTSHFYYSYSY